MGKERNCGSEWYSLSSAFTPRFVHVGDLGHEIETLINLIISS